MATDSDGDAASCRGVARKTRKWTRMSAEESEKEAAAKGIRAGPKTPATNSETVGINGSVNVLQKGTSVPRGHNSRFVIPYFPAGVASLCFVISVAKFVGNISSYFRDFGNEIDGNIFVVFPKFRQRNRLQTFSDFPH